MKEHCERMMLFTHRMSERLYDMDLTLTMNHPEGSGLFADAIMLSQALLDKLEIVGAYYEHNGHLP